MSTSTSHKPVLVKEVIEYLQPKPNGIYIDVTFGSGGHTRAILEHEPTCKVIAFDWDIVSIETFAPPLEEIFADRLTVMWGNFAHLYKLLKKLNIRRVDGILADFGTSQMQLKERAGFSFAVDTPLDMRMSPSHQLMTAAHVVNTAEEKELRELFWQLGEEKHAKIIARAIVDRREEKPFATTADLAQVIERTVGRSKGIHPATQVFQALRIYINKELENIHAFLAEAVRVVDTHGRIVCISFHSLEDRLVKQFFNEKKREGVLELLTPKVVVADEAEILANPSARSARLRAARKTGSFT